MQGKLFPDAVQRPFDLSDAGPRVALAELVRGIGTSPIRLYALRTGGSGPALVSHELSKLAPVLHIAPDEERAGRTHSDLAAFAAGLLGTRADPAQEPLLLPARDHSPFSDVHPDRRVTLERASALFHLARGLPYRALVTTARAWMRKVPPKALLSEAGHYLESGGELDLEDLSRRLTRAGYLRVPLVEDPGAFAVRGAVVDIWPAGALLPVRAELEFDRVGALRRFDPETQRTGDATSAVWLPPAREAILTPETEVRARERVRALADARNLPSTRTRQLVEGVGSGSLYFGIDAYLPAYFELVPLGALLSPNVIVVVEEPAEVLRELRSAVDEAERDAAGHAERPHFPLSAHFASEDELERDLCERRVVSLQASVVQSGPRATGLDRLDAFPPDTPSLDFHAQDELARAMVAARGERGRTSTLDPLLGALEAWAEHGLRVTLTARAPLQAERIGALLRNRGLRVQAGDFAESQGRAAGRAGAGAGADAVEVVVSPLRRGLIAPLGGLVLLTEEEIFGERSRTPSKKQRVLRSALEDLAELLTGDYVVHVDHGIGRYRGLERRSVDGARVDLLVVEYDAGTLYLPVYRLNQIQKYGVGEKPPKLDRLGGQSFAKTKARAKRRARDIADALLRLYAERRAHERRELPPPGDDYREFEATFPYEETSDQAAAIAEVLRDLCGPHVMDRLVCGDVGFGKTEVALRAAFVRATAGRQVALLCPTTVLAQQHYATFRTRLAPYALNVAALSRFQKRTEISETLRGLQAGSIDVVIGTHRLLSKDVHFKNLGLLVIDEEQRFGVAHKERIKQLKNDIDVLTLSATPIPRTLHMAVSGLRDLSLITTPPVDRRAIRTIVSRFDEALVGQAVERELARGGQAFYVYNRVDGLEERAERLRRIVPQARLGIAHGQMREALLERTMLEFVAGDFDVLVATALIESGLDIPRANTILIDRADYLGLSQLYQLRGRVGRARERAYCYLLVPDGDELSPEARARVEALERHTDLGAGFHIASLDLELRGAGELLGAEQKGYVEGVGLELFTRLLEEATHELRGEPPTHDVDPELGLDVEAFLPEEYVPETGVRLSLYKRLAGAASEAEVEDLADELSERFGSPPPEARRFIELMRMKTELRGLRALGVEASARSITLHLRADTPLDPRRLGELVERTAGRYRLTPDGKIKHRAGLERAFRDGLEHLGSVLDELAACTSSPR